MWTGRTAERGNEKGRRKNGIFLTKARRGRERKGGEKEKKTGERWRGGKGRKKMRGVKGRSEGREEGGRKEKQNEIERKEERKKTEKEKLGQVKG